MKLKILIPKTHDYENMYMYGTSASGSGSGPTGPTGADGLMGHTGATGADGLMGHTGATGADGLMGHTGPGGGATGATGADGLVGHTGATGADGLMGHTGTTGADGLMGHTGATGADGLMGHTGATGADGLMGHTGATGADGLVGHTGATGADGLTGHTGPIGENLVLPDGNNYGEYLFWDGFKWISADKIQLGKYAGMSNQDASGIAVGSDAAWYDQGPGCIAIGNDAGCTGQVKNSIAIGQMSGNIGQGENAISVGHQSGNQRQSINAISIGNSAGLRDQGDSSIALGKNAGFSEQGDNSIAIGANAGFDTQHENSIIINAATTSLDNKNNEGLFIKPIRQETPENKNILMYDSTTGEVTHNDYIEATKINMGESSTDTYSLSQTVDYTDHAFNNIKMGLTTKMTVDLDENSLDVLYENPIVISTFTDAMGVSGASGPVYNENPIQYDCSISAKSITLPGNTTSGINNGLDESERIAIQRIGISGDARNYFNSTTIFTGTKKQFTNAEIDARADKEYTSILIDGATLKIYNYDADKQLYNYDADNKLILPTTTFADANGHNTIGGNGTTLNGHIMINNTGPTGDDLGITHFNDGNGENSIKGTRLYVHPPMHVDNVLTLTSNGTNKTTFNCETGLNYLHGQTRGSFVGSFQTNAYYSAYLNDDTTIPGYNYWRFVSMNHSGDSTINTNGFSCFSMSQERDETADVNENPIQLTGMSYSNTTNGTQKDIPILFTSEVLLKPPVNDSNPATKKYVDDEITPLEQRIQHIEELEQRLVKLESALTRMTRIFGNVAVF